MTPFGYKISTLGRDDRMCCSCDTVRLHKSVAKRGLGAQRYHHAIFTDQMNIARMAPTGYTVEG